MGNPSLSQSHFLGDIGASSQSIPDPLKQDIRPIRDFEKDLTLVWIGRVGLQRPFVIEQGLASSILLVKREMNFAP